MGAQPLVGQFAEDLEAVVRRYYDQGLTVSEALGALDLIHGRIVRDALENDEDEE